VITGSAGSAYTITIPNNSTVNVGGILGNPVGSSRTVSLSGAGANLVLHGYDMVINGEEQTVLVANLGPAALAIGGTAATITLQSSGVVHADGDVTLNPKIVGDYSITKTGTGTLTLGRGGLESTFSGGFILDGGVVNTYGSSATTGAGPFGTGTLTLRSGQIRTQGANGRTYTNAVALDGSIILGHEDYMGDIYFSAGNMGNATTLLRDSEISTINYSTWNQKISGDYSLTKSGTGALALTNVANDYSGKTIVAGGALFVTGALLNSEVEVQAGAVLGGTSSATAGTGFYREVVVKTGGRLRPGIKWTNSASNRNVVGTLQFFDNLVLEEGSTVEFTLGSTSSKIYFTANLSLDGANLELSLGLQPVEGTTYVLFENDGFGSITGNLVYDGQTLGEGSIFLVESGSYSQYFQITYQYHVGEFGPDSIAITAVAPIPEAGALFHLGVIGAGAGVLAYRRRRAAA